MSDQGNDQLATAMTTFAETLGGVDVTAAVPSCPGWTVADLVDHLGGVHQWARHAVVEGNPHGEPEEATGDLVAWYRRHAGELLETLRLTDPGAPAWTFGTEQTVRWWTRRQTHEVLMHTRDLVEAAGRVEEWSVDPEFAWDGVGEVATEFYPRQVRLDRTEPLPGTLRLLATDLPDAEPVTIGEAEPVVEVQAPAVELLLMLWHRRAAPDGPAADLLGRPITP